MKFILDERAYVEQLLSENTIGKSEKISIRLLIKHYRSIGLSKEESIVAMVEFMSLTVPQFKEFQWKQTIERLANVVYENEQELIVVDKVEITQNELDFITSIEDNRQQKVLFCLLVYKKVQNKMHKQENEWFNGSLSEIFKMAKISGKHGTVAAQCKMIYDLKELGAISLAKSVKSLNLKLNFLESQEKPQSEMAMTITDFRDVVFFYCQLIGERVVQCQHCGKMIKLKKNERSSRKYCTTCKKVINSEKVARFRNSEK